jgi:hypothetical protein
MELWVVHSLKPFFCLSYEYEFYSLLPEQPIRLLEGVTQIGPENWGEFSQPVQSLFSGEVTLWTEKRNLEMQNQLSPDVAQIADRTVGSSFWSLPGDSTLSPSYCQTY